MMAVATEQSMNLEYGGDPEETDPCTGCKKTLEEGKAFELANHRWHIECFRCGNCKTLLDADANLLLLGDGTLICQSCTYSCFNCGNKIEDLAILTGDQAFCATCFRCRNCKKKIDNLRYARTSMGIFCMECHDMLMARRKKAKDQKVQSRKPVGNRTPGQSPSPMILDKSLPSLPPSIAIGDSQFPLPQTSLRDREPPSRSALMNDTTISRNSDSPDSIQRKPVPLPAGELSGVPPASARNPMFEKDGILLQPHTYSPTLSQGSGRSPRVSPNELTTDPFSYIPLGFDPTPPTTSSAFPSPQQPVELPVELEAPVDRRPSDQVHRHISEQSARPKEKGKAVESASKSARPAALPRDHSLDELNKSAISHIATLDRAKKASSDRTASKESGRSQLATPVPSSPLTQMSTPKDKAPEEKRSVSAQSGIGQELNGERNGESFKLQDAPKRRRTGSRGSMMSLGLGIENVPGAEGALQNGSLLLDSQSTLTPGPRNPNRLSKVPSEASTILADKLVTSPVDDSKPSFRRGPSTNKKKHRGDNDAPLATSASIRSTDSGSSLLVNRPPRGDSLARHDSKHRPRAEQEPGTNSPGHSANNSTLPSPRGSGDSVSSTPNLMKQALRKGHPNFIADYSAPLSPKSTIPSARDGIPLSVETSDESREGPQAYLDESSPSSPPVSNATSAYSEETKAETRSQELLRYSGGGTFTMDDDMARIMGGAGNDSHPSVLRRVSNAVQRHGRSVSDNANQTPRKGRVSIHEGAHYDGGSSIHPSPKSTKELMATKGELRRSHQKIAELEAKVTTIEDIKVLDTKVREKRSTVAYLDSQREVMMKEMDVFAVHHQRAKESGLSLNPKTFKADVLGDLADELEELKATYQSQIEERIRRFEEVSRRVQALEDKERDLNMRIAIQQKESERLYDHQSQLADLNNELSHAIQAKSVTERPPASPKYGSGSGQGLGIYNSSSTTFVNNDSRDGRLHSSHGGQLGAAPQTISEDDQPMHTISTPKVINIRKAQAKKFSWKKEGKALAGGVKKGIKGAFNPTNSTGNDGLQPSFIETVPYGQTQMNQPSNNYSNQQHPSEGMPGSSTLPRSMTADHNLKLFSKRRHGLGQTGKSQSNSNLVEGAAEPPSSLYGSELEARAEYERCNIPSILTRCIAEVEMRGMDVEGIYRRNGGHTQVKQIIDGIEQYGEGHDISDPDLDITSVTSALKQYLRQLPTPLIPHEVYPEVMKAQALPDTEERVEALRQILSTLPSAHRDTLGFLIFHLSRVAEQRVVNLMDAKNLAVCFGPTIMRTRELGQEMSDYQTKNLLVQTLIEHTREIFLAGGEDGLGASTVGGVGSVGPAGVAEASGRKASGSTGTGTLVGGGGAGSGKSSVSAAAGARDGGGRKGSLV